jgi:hypothetical protein
MHGQRNIKKNIVHVSIATKCVLSIVVGIDVAVSNIEVFSAAT